MSYTPYPGCWGRAVRAMSALALLAITAQTQAFEIEIPEEALQAQVITVFPVTQRVPFVAATLSDPRIRIVPGSTRLNLAVAIEARFANDVTATGWAEIAGEPAYNPDAGEFYLRRPGVTELHFDSLPREYLDLLRALVNTMATQMVPGILVYRLDERDFQQGVMRRVLRGLSIRDGKLIAEMDWGTPSDGRPL